MPNNYDGDIKLRVGINATDTKKAAADLATQIKNAFQSLAGKEVTVRMKTIQKNIADTMYKAQEFAKSMDEFGSKKIPTAEYKNLEKELEKANKEHEELVRRAAQLAEAGLAGDPTKKKTWTPAYAKLQDDIQGAVKEVRYLEYEMDELNKKGKAFTLGSDTDEYKKMVSQSAAYNNQMRVQLAQLETEVEKEKQKEVDAAEKAFQQVEKGLQKAADEMVKEEQRVAREAEREAAKAAAATERQVSRVQSVISRVASSTMANMRAMTTRLKQMLTTIVRMGTSIAKSGISKLGQIFHIGSKASRGFDFNLKRGITTVLKYAFGIRSLYFLFRKLRSAVKEAFEAMAQQIPEVNKDLSQITSAWQDFKNALGTAFQPLLAAITPILTRIIEMLTNATIKVGEFFAALTGQEYVYKATKANIDYAKSLDKTAKAKQKNNKEDEKALGSYDKLEVIQKKQNKDSDDDSGLDTSKGVYQKAPISKGVSDFMKRLKETWDKNGDFTWLGEMIAERIKNALKKIPWDYIKYTAGKLGKAFAQILNGIFKDMELARVVGNTVAQALNTALEFIWKFLNYFDAKQFGRWLGETISSGLRNIDWDKVKRTARLLGKRIADFINGLFSTDVLYQVGNAIGNIGRAIVDFFYDLVTNIDFPQLAKQLKSGLNVMFDRMLEVDGTGKTGFRKLGEVITRIWTGIFTTLSTVINDPKLREKLKTAITEFFNGIDYSAMKNSLMFFASSVIGLLGDCIKAAFNSPEFTEGFLDLSSTVLKIFAIIFPIALLGAIAKLVIAGLFTQLGKQLAVSLVANGPAMLAKLSAFGTSLGTSITTGISSALSTAGAALTAPITTLGGAMCAAFVSIPVALGGLEIGKKISAAVTPVPYLDEEYKGIQGTFKMLKDFFVIVGEEFVDAAKLIWVDIKSVFTGMGEYISKTLQSWAQSISNFKNKIFGSGTTVNVRSGGASAINYRSDPRYHLAKGAVIPPNKEFTAVLGDQKQGTNIETPLSTMVEAFKTALQESGGTGRSQGDIVLQLEGREVARVVWDEENKRYKQTGQYRPRMA